MSRITQGDGSSPSGPTIRKRDRQRLAGYDRAIQLLDVELFAMRLFRDPVLKKAVAKREAIDEKRRTLRAWMKGYKES